MAIFDGLPENYELSIDQAIADLTRHQAVLAYMSDSDRDASYFIDDVIGYMEESIRALAKAKEEFFNPSHERLDQYRQDQQAEWADSERDRRLAEHDTGTWGDFE